jgi:hypothetical protein
MSGIALCEKPTKAGWDEKFGDLQHPTVRDALQSVGLLGRSHHTSEGTAGLRA